MSDGFSEKGKWHNEADRNPTKIEIRSLHDLDELKSMRTNEILVVHGDAEGLRGAAFVADFVRNECKSTSPLVYVSQNLIPTQERVRFFDRGGDALLDGKDVDNLQKTLMALHKRMRLYRESAEQATRVPFDGLRVDKTMCRIYVRDRLIALGPQEYKILALLAERYPSVVRHAVLEEHVNRDMPRTNNIAVHIKNIRKKIAPFKIAIIRKLGYRLMSDTDSSAA